MPDAPRKLLRRREIPGTARFLTFSCYRRLPLFNNDRIKTRFVETLVSALKAFDTQLIAWVIMPEHVHLIVHADKVGVTPKFLQKVKDPFAREVLKRWRSLDAAILAQLKSTDGALHFWQPGGGYDRNVVDDELIEKIRYIHANPIKRGLTIDSVSWPWSSARAYRGHPDALGPPIAFDLVPPHSNGLT